MRHKTPEGSKSTKSRIFHWDTSGFHARLLSLNSATYLAPLEKILSPRQFVQVAVLSDPGHGGSKLIHFSALCGYTGHRLMHHRARSCEGLRVCQIRTARSIRRLWRVLHNQFDDSPHAFSRPVT